VVDQLRALGVTTGGVVVVHTSFKAVGPIEVGPIGPDPDERIGVYTPPTSLRAPPRAGRDELPQAEPTVPTFRDGRR
jgi:hypothetical protein